ncbi:hypothetical protein [Parasitella parasitica]|uniref:RNA polymerase II degradation factor 1 n=1 Tax=Parasitella parasitica TaxID=35722 RepID=A0A0B7MX24_9FUNG|nr:hypothetical protein [Parasitella parasitica]
MPPNSGVRQRNNTNDIKSLRAKYKQALPSLTELFPEWSHNDLLFAMDECRGDLELAIARISEGHANQWGQVKSKKSKPKPATQPNPKRTNHKSTPTASTAAAAAAVPTLASANDAVAEGKDKSRKHKKDKTQKATAEKEQDLKPSWASIAKGPTKPEVVVNSIEDSQSDAQPALTNEENKNKVDAVVIKEEEEAALVDQVEQSETVEQTLYEAIEQPAEEQPICNEPETAVGAPVEPEPTVEPVIIAAPVAVTATMRKPTIIRRLNQTEPVVLPHNQQVASLSSINVQFGSLTLNNGEEVIKDENEEAVEETAINVNAAKQEPPPDSVAEIKVNATPLPKTPAAVKDSEHTKANDASTVAAVSNGLASYHNVNKPLPQPFQPQQHHYVQPQQQQQPLQPIQHVYNEPYTMNPYAAYVPNVHNSVAGYTGGLPTDYYGADPQRMVCIASYSAEKYKTDTFCIKSYYDTSFYSQSPVMNGNANVPLFARDKYNTPPHPPIEIMNHTPPPHPPAPQYARAHPHPPPHHHPHAPPPPPPQPQSYGYYSVHYQQQQQPQQPPQPPYVNKSVYNAAIPVNKYDYSAYEDYYQQQQNNNEMAYSSSSSSNTQIPPPLAHQQPQPFYQQQQQPRQPYWQ